LVIDLAPEPTMAFFITALDTSGSITLRRESVFAAIKKADELISDGCWNVEIAMPDGAIYAAGEFELLKEWAGARPEQAGISKEAAVR
jgi:hypothetical protein